MRRRLPAGSADVVPAALVVALLVWLAAGEAGYAITRWAPVGLVAILLLATRAAVDPPRLREVPRLVLVAAAALALYAAWSGLSVAWAQDQGVAWVGADRTLLYLALFLLLALWPLRVEAGAALTGVWALAIAVLAVVTLLRAASSGTPLQLFVDARLVGPAGYVNASSALWMMALFPALVLAAARRTPWAARGLLAAGAVVLADVALLSQSRGSVIAVPVTAAALLIGLPGRVRFAAVLVGVGAGVAVTEPSMQAVIDAVRAGRSPAGDLDTAVLVALVAAAIVGVVVALGGLLATRRPPSAAFARRTHRAGAGATALAVVAIAIVGIAIVGSPASAASRAWHSFKAGYGESRAATGNRLTTGLGSNRYDFYRVGLAEFRRHPVGGTGADTFAQAYLRSGRSTESPAYPHSLEIRALVSTGLVGALLLLAFVVALLTAVVLGAGTLGTPLGVAGIAAFAYWLVHGSADWFWEIAGLGGAAIALGALAAATLPRRTPDPPRPAAGVWGRAVAVVACVAAAVAIVPPWLAQRQTDVAGRTFATDPGGAIARLRSAASLDRLDARPLTVEGAAWLRLQDPTRARQAFAAALDRDRANFYATLQLSAIASASGDRQRARTLVARALALAPRDYAGRRVAAVIRRGDRVDLAVLQEMLRQDARAFAAR